MMKWKKNKIIKQQQQQWRFVRVRYTVKNLLLLSQNIYRLFRLIECRRVIFTVRVVDGFVEGAKKRFPRAYNNNILYIVDLIRTAERTHLIYFCSFKFF